MSFPFFFGLEAPTAGDAGKEIGWTSSEVNRRVTWRVIKPAQRLYKTPSLRTGGTDHKNITAMNAAVTLPFQVAIKEGNVFVNTTTVNYWTSVTSWTASGEGRVTASSS